MGRPAETVNRNVTDITVPWLDILEFAVDTQLDDVTISALCSIIERPMYDGVYNRDLQ